MRFVTSEEILEQLMALSLEEKKLLDAGIDNRGMEGAFLERRYYPVAPDDSPLEIAVKQATELLNASREFQQKFLEEQYPGGGEE